MKNLTFSAFILLAVVFAASAAQHSEGWRSESTERMTFTADQVALDNVTKEALATGHVSAVSRPYSLRGEYLHRDVAGVYHFGNPTCVTTCTNEVGHTHWNVTGEVVYSPGHSVVVKEAWVRYQEIPLIYLPYFWYPLDWDCGFSWMPGYTGRWGAFLLTKTSYHLLGDRSHGENTWWLRGNTSVDLRTKNGVALGETLRWNLGDFGKGKFRVYHAWDQDADSRYNKHKDIRKYANWGSEVDENRYSVDLEHSWQATERDTVFLRGTYLSDSHFRRDFLRKSFFEIKGQWQTYQNSGVFWEHLEKSFIVGAEVSGRLNDFYAATERLPEFFIDVNPSPVFDLPINYESQNRFGRLLRDYAQFSKRADPIYARLPGAWAKYDTYRLDTYHRLTAPFRMCDDVVSVVPRVAWHGTGWTDSGETLLIGNRRAAKGDELFRSIGEVGATFAARGRGWIDDSCQHMIEPYLDTLFQKAWYAGRKGNNRPYVFDNIDASMVWEDQFAGRSRNLPYSYYGVTPGVRNTWSWLEESGNLHQVIDFDVYAAVMFGATKYEGERDSHKLAALGRRNYGEDDVNVMPGARLKWNPAGDLSILARAEVDTDNGRFAVGDLGLNQTISEEFNYSVIYNYRNHRWWDFASSGYKVNGVTGEATPGYDDFNEVSFHLLRLECEYRPVEWLGFGPFVRWDLRENELDSIGAWAEYLTDCLGYRLQIEYDNDYERYDGYKDKEDWHFGFYVFLRAFGSTKDFFGAH